MPNVKDVEIDSYDTYLFEKYRPPGKGGNTKALHVHAIFVDGVKYTFFALGTKKWVYKGDKVSFEYEEKGPYKNIKKETIQVVDSKGKSAVRGNRGFKNNLRSADTRMPCSRREARS